MLSFVTQLLFSRHTRVVCFITDVVLTVTKSFTIHSVYVEEMYEAWKVDPTSVHKSWDVYFRHSDAGRDASEVSLNPTDGRYRLAVTTPYS